MPSRVGFNRRGRLSWRSLHSPCKDNWPTMAISLHPRHLKRYSALAKLLVKYGRSDVVRQAGLEKTLVEEDEAARKGTAPADLPIPPEAEELAADLEKLGPTFIKLG